jgi:hypothetical protein
MAKVTAYWSDIGLNPATFVTARDLWAVRYIYPIHIIIF